MAGFAIVAVLGLLGLLALSSMACLLRSDDDLLLVDNRARLDALLATGIASMEQMQRIQDDTWLGASTDSDDEIDDSVLANLQLPTSTDSTLGGVDPPEDFPSPGAMWGLIASQCIAPESPFMPSNGTPSRASPHIPPEAHKRFCFPVWTTASTQSSAQHVRSAAHADPVETPGRSRVPVQEEPVGRDKSDHADVVISPTIPVYEVNDDGSKRRRLDRGTFGEECPSGALLASQQLLEHADSSLIVVARIQTQVAYRSQSLDSLKSVMFNVLGV